MATESFIEKQAGGIDPYARELADEELEDVAGGGDYCPDLSGNPYGETRTYACDENGKRLS
jgi:hypothetical protein